MLINTNSLARKFKPMNRLYREIVQIELYSNNVNGEDRHCLSRLWKSLMHFVMKEGSWILQQHDRRAVVTEKRKSLVEVPITSNVA